MSDLKQQALAVAVLAALGERITRAAEQARADLLAVMQEIGAERVAAELPDGKGVASVSLAASTGGRAYVASEADFTRWVAGEHPTELEYTVRSAFRKQLLAELSKTQEAIPGVDFADARPYLKNTFKADGKEAIAKAWQAEELAELMSRLLAIEGGES
jgi:hypothetical protein